MEEEMDEAEREIRAAAAALDAANNLASQRAAELKALFIKWRAAGRGPSEMGRWSDMTREWVGKLAPDPARTRKKG